MKHPLRAVAVLAALWGLGTSLGAAVGPKKVDQIALVVDQESMTQGELDEEVQGYYAAQGVKPPAPSSAEYQKVKATIVDAFIREVLLAEEADRQKIEIQDGDIEQNVNNEFEGMKKRYPSESDFLDALKKEGISEDELRQTIHDQLVRRMKANRVMQTKQREAPGSVFVTDEETKAYYEKHPKDFQQVKFAIILFRTPPKSTAAYVKEVQKQAQDLLAQLKAGADFEAFAKKYSEDPISAAKGGQMDPIYRVDLNPKLANGIFAIPAHGLGLVRAEDGIYLVRVDRKSDGDYDTVAPAIKEHLKRQRQSGAMAQWLDGLRKAAYIVQDGKVVTYRSSVEEASTPSTPVPSPDEEGTKDGDGKKASAAAGTQATPEATPAPEAKKAVYPTLPAPGSLVLELGAKGYGLGIKALSDHYGPGINVDQNFPFGLGLDGTVDYALDPTIEVGLTAKTFNNVPQKVNFSPAGQSAYTDSWSASVFGPGLEARVLIPLDETTNFSLCAGGGYYFLVSGGVTVVGSGLAEGIRFNSEDFGADASASVEFFLDSNMDSALDLNVGYQYLRFNKVTANLAVNNSGPYATFPSPLTNQDGSPGMLDLSGVKAGVSFRFYLDKNG